MPVRRSVLVLSGKPPVCESRAAEELQVAEGLKSLANGFDLVGIKRLDVGLRRLDRGGSTTPAGLRQGCAATVMGDEVPENVCGELGYRMKSRVLNDLLQLFVERPRDLEGYLSFSTISLRHS
jgi:hypothetical protein